MRSVLGFQRSSVSLQRSVFRKGSFHRSTHDSLLNHFTVSSFIVLDCRLPTADCRLVLSPITHHASPFFDCQLSFQLNEPWLPFNHLTDSLLWREARLVSLSLSGLACLAREEPHKLRLLFDNYHSPPSLIGPSFPILSANAKCSFHSIIQQRCQAHAAEAYYNTHHRAIAQ